jgi:hypothetical protein
MMAENGNFVEPQGLQMVSTVDQFDTFLSPMAHAQKFKNWLFEISAEKKTEKWRRFHDEQKLPKLE